MPTYCRKTVAMGDHYLYCDKDAGHDSYCWHEGGKITERPVVTLGDDVDAAYTPDGKHVLKLEIWRSVLVDGVPSGRCRRDKGRPMREIYRELGDIMSKEDLFDESFSMIAGWNQDDKQFPASVRIDPVYMKDGKYNVRWTPPGAHGGDWYSDASLVETFKTKEDAEKHRARILALYGRLPGKLDVDGDDEQRDMLWPDRVRWVACYAVTGGSEGHYVHVDAIHDMEHTAIGSVRVTRSLFLAKTFRGMEHAQKIAARFASLLGS